MCENCPPLWTARTTTTATPLHLRRCHAYALPMDVTPPHTVCPGCIVYALLHQNTLLQRWQDIHDTLRPTPPIQQHRFIHSPDPILGPGISGNLAGTSTPPTHSNTPTPRQVIDLTLHQHADNEIVAVFARSTADTSAMVHRYHSHMALTLRHLRRLRIILCPSDTHQLPLRVLYHQLLISARSPLIPRDRHLSISMDNTIYAMTPNATHDSSTRLHYIQLFLNPSTGSPYLFYTFHGQPNANSLLSAQRLTITTSLPSSLPFTKRPRRYCMMRTTSHAPNLGKTITFPVDSVQHQMTILTLVTHMILLIPLLRLKLLSWRPVR